MMKISLSVVVVACLALVVSVQAANSTKAYKLGWLMSFPLQDLTWSYAHDFARQRLELELDRGQIITTERCCIPEDSPDEAYNVGKEMVTTYSHDLVLVQSPQLTAGFVKLANEFPNKFFVLYPPDPTQIPKWPINLGAGFAAFFQATYLAGRLAAQMTKTKKVGYIVGYSINIVYASVNAHFIGIRRISKDVQLYVIETGNWYDQRLHTQATNQLVDLGCDVISMYGTGMYYVTAARDRSTKANPVWSVGLHTDAQAHIIGATAVVSLLFDWLPQYRTFTLKLLNNTWDQTLQYQFGTVQNGVVKLSAYHPDVPQSARDDVDKEYDKLKQSDGDFFCDPLVAELKPANKDYPGCLSSDQINYMAKYLTGVNKVNGVFFWNELFWDYSDGAGIAAAVLNSLSLLATIFYTIIVIKYMNTPIIKAASPLFCFIILGCGFIGHAIVYIVIAKPSDITCQLYLWLAGIAIATLLSSLLLKLFRVWRLFSSARKLAVSVIPIPHLVAAMSVAVAIELVILVIWTAVDPLEATLKDEGDVAFDERLLMCHSDTLILWRVLFFVYGGILLGGNAILAFLVRDVKSAFAESKMIALMTYNILLISVILLPIVWIFSDKWQAVFIIRVFGILYVVTSTMALLFVPKVIVALGVVEAPVEDMTTRSKASTQSK